MNLLILILILTILISEPNGDCGVGFNPYDASTWGPCVFAIGYWSMGCALDNHVHVSYVGE